MFFYGALVEVAAAVARRTEQQSRSKAAVADLLMPSYLDLVPLTASLRDGAITLAAELGLRAADAVYVALAQLGALPLVTWDQEQRARAAPRVTTFAPNTFSF